jgi:iron complex outermembrane receptor protein
MSIRKTKLAQCLRQALLGGVALTLAMPVLADAAAATKAAPSDQAQSAPTDVAATSDAGKKPDPTQLDAVVVTSQSREQSLQEVPIAVQVVSDEMIVQVTAYDLGDLDAFVPGLEVSSESPTQPRFKMRGISTSDFGIGTDSAVGVYIDGVYAARSGGALLALNDVERIEVLKGPQGTLFGRNSAAGAISIISKKPGDEFEGRARLRFGNDGRQYADALLNIATGDTSALRISALRNKSDGWLTDSATGEDYYGDDNWATRAAFRWDASDATQVLLSWDHEHVDQLARPVIGIVALPPYPGLPAYPADPASYLDPREAPVFNDVIGNEESRVFDGVTLNIDHATSWGHVVSTTAWRGFETVNREDEDGTNRINLYFDTANREDNDSWYQEFKFSGANDRIDWVAGISYYDEKASQQSETNAFTDSMDTVLLNLAGVPAYSLVEQVLQDFQVPATLFGYGWTETMANEGRFKAAAAFGDVIWHLNERTNLTTGLRYTHDSKTFSWLNGARIAPELDATLAALDAMGFFDADPLLQMIRPVFDMDVVFALPPDVEGATVTASNSWSDWSPRVVLDYSPSDDLMWFASATKGYKAGGYNSVEVGSLFNNEDVWSYEAGFKSAFPGQRLVFNGSTFYYVYSDKQSIRLDPNSGGSGIPQYLVDTADEQAWGMEFDALWQATDALGLLANIAYIDATYKDKVTDAGVDLSGDPTGEAKWSFSVGGNYRWMTGHGDVELGVLHAYRGEGRCNGDSLVQGTCAATPNFKVGGAQQRTDLRLAWTSPDTRWGVAAYVNNAFDNRYVTGVGGLTRDVFGTATGSVTAPRMVGVELRADF